MSLLKNQGGPHNAHYLIWY